MNTASPIDADAIIERHQLGGYRICIFVMCAFVMLFDGIDAQLMPYLAPALKADWALSPNQLAGIFSASLFGIMLGALFIAPIADRVGRRPVLLTSALCIGIFTLATGFANSLEMMIALRFVTGLGLGAAMANAVAMIAEYAPSARRSFLVAMIFSGFTLGAILGGVLAHQLLPLYGWRIVPQVAGVVTLAFFPVAFLWLPESVRFLRHRPAARERLVAILRRIDPTAGEIAISPPQGEDVAAPGLSVVQLFRDGRARQTILLWIIFFMSLLDVFMLVNWLPTVIAQAGHPVRTAILVSTTMQVGGLIAALPLGWLMDRKGVRKVLAPSYLVAAVAIAAIGFAANISIALTILVVFVAGCGIIGGQAAINALASSIYPTRMRSTGVGWALGIGRIGSIVGPMVGGLLMTAQVDMRMIFMLSAIPALVAASALVILTLRRVEFVK